MSNLKHQTLKQLLVSKAQCEELISSYNSKLSGQTTRLGWINDYIFKATVKEMTIGDIESALGHRVIIK